MKQLKPYPKYKPSGVEWLGDVPEHWDVTKIKRGYSVKLGKMLQPNQRSDSDQLLPYMRASNIQPSGIDVSNVKKMWFTPTEQAVLRLSHGDLLVSEGGDVGRSAIWSDEVPAAYFQNSINRIHPLRQNSNIFLNYLLHSIKHTGVIDVICNRLSIAHLTAEKLNEIDVLFPSTTEQSSITAFLDHETGRIDALVEKKNRFIELLKEKRQALITDAVTGKFDVSTGKPYPAYKSSGVEWLGDVPEEWEVCRVGALYREVSDKGDNELPILTISIHHGASNNELSEDERDRKVVRIDDKSKYKRVQPGDLVYNMMRAWQGGFGAILVKGLVSPAYVVARSKIELSSEYIELQFRTPQAIEAMRRYSHGITDFRLRLYWEKFKTMFVTLPTFSGQTQIMDFIFSETGRIDSLCDKTEKSIELLKEKRQALITATVTGKIDVRNS